MTDAAPPEINVDQVLTLARPVVENEVSETLKRLRLSDLTDAEIIAWATFIRPIYARVKAEFTRRSASSPAVLTLVPPTT